jgi:preprotein translocase subunit SecD
MKSRLRLFNGFLAVTLCAMGTACKTGAERERARQMSTLRIHVETDRGSTDRASAISVHRGSPILLNVGREAILDESHVSAVRLVDEPGGLFAVEIQFDRRGSWILEHATVANKGRHLAIFSQFGEHARWLSAPVIHAKNSSGLLRFTPDASREEAERFVRGLNNLSRKIERRENWPFKGPIDR